MRLSDSVASIFSRWPMSLPNHIQIKDPFKVQDWWISFNSKEFEKFINTVFRLYSATYQVNLIYYQIHSYPQLYEKPVKIVFPSLTAYIWFINFNQSNISECRLNEEADMRIQLSAKSTGTEICKMWKNAIVLINCFCFGEYRYLYNNIIYVNFGMSLLFLNELIYIF